MQYTTFLNKIRFVDGTGHERERKNSSINACIGQLISQSRPETCSCASQMCSADVASSKQV